MKAIQTSSDWNSEKEGEKNQYCIFQSTISAFEKRPLITCLWVRQTVAQSAFKGEPNRQISGKPERERERDITEKSVLTVKPAVKGRNALSGSRAKWILSSLQPGLTSPYQEDSWCPPDQGVRLSMTQKQREEAAWVSLIRGVAVFSILVHYNKMKSIFRAPMASWWSDCPVYI